jgi:hypothetical protein
LATRCLCALDPGDERGLTGGMEVLERAVTDRVLKREEGRGVSLTWRGGDSIMVRHERTRWRR